MDKEQEQVTNGQYSLNFSSSSPSSSSFHELLFIGFFTKRELWIFKNFEINRI